MRGCADSAGSAKVYRHLLRCSVTALYRWVPLFEPISVFNSVDSEIRMVASVNTSPATVCGFSYKD